ncbi:MAG: hypothetical protein WBA93_31480 [Microcoleaceae cyanobacterium]
MVGNIQTYGEKLGTDAPTQYPIDKAPILLANDWKASGKIIKCGLYRTENNCYLNTECNGSANNIIIKVSAKTRIRLKLTV